MASKELHTACWQLMRQRRFKEAFAVAQQLCEARPDVAESWYSLSSAAKGARLNPVALEAIDKALAVSPQDPEYQAHKSLCLLAAGRTPDAVKLARRIKDERPVKLQVLNTIAFVFNAGAEFNDQLEVTSLALQLGPQDTQALANYAEALRNVGRMEDAEMAYSELINIDGSAYSAYWSRSHCIKASQSYNFVKELREKLAVDEMPWRGKMQLCFALAKELEDLGRFELSFDYLANGADLRRENSNYDVGDDIQTMEEIMSVYSRPPLKYTGFDSGEPIFVLGLPRSGTTLVERILGGHSDVFDAGEMQSFPTELVKLIQKNSGGRFLDKLANVRASMNVDWATLGRAYLESTRPRTGQTKHFVDKLPSNYLYIGLIKRALPSARIVLVERGPMDSCFAMYKTLFGEAYPFTYSLSDLGEYFVAWQRLMAHWKSQFPESITVISYESVVLDTENTVRKLLDFCGLDWQDECLRFHERRSGVSTASASQVRQPIYTSSVGRWRKFGRQLEPLADILQSANIELN